MPWVRIDENALTHPKIVNLSHGAFRLWVAGLAHCQQHLTDGAIPDAALRTFPAVNQARISELCAAGLWRPDGKGYVVHDYLEHNDSRAKVLKARKQGLERKRRWEDKKNALPDALPDALRTAYAPSDVVCSGESQKLLGREGGVGETRTDPVGSFVDWYGEAHERYVGVGYIGNPQKDYQSAIQLCKTFSEKELRNAVLVWFGMDDDFARNGTRTITKFASRASHCVQLARKVSA